MLITIPFILLDLVGKCLLNWTLILIHRNHGCKSFLGVFGVSVAIVDTTLALFVATIHLHPDGYILLLGLKLTKFHVCLLLQILGQVYSVLQWPVVILAGLDHFYTLTMRFYPTVVKAKWLVCMPVTGLLWYLAALYVFLLCKFHPVLEDVPHNQIHQCWVLHTPQIQQVTTMLLLSLVFAALHARYSTQMSKGQNTDQSMILSRKYIVDQAIHIFLKIWGLFLIFLAVIFMLPARIPAYLGLNVAWLSFLNSTLIAFVLCSVCPASQLTEGLAAVPPDGFCEWTFKFSSGAEDSTCLLCENTHRTHENQRCNLNAFQMENEKVTSL